MMKSLLLVLAFVCLAVAQVEQGICRFVPTGTAGEGITGTATFTTTTDGVTVTIDASGIPVNDEMQVGIHVHTNGDIRPSVQPGYNVGGHYNPTGVAYGCPGQAVREYGDMGNWSIATTDVDATTGSVSETKTLDLLALTGVNSIIGRSVVIHARPDNCVNLTSSSTRLAYCVIGIANTTTQTNLAYNSNTAITYGTCSLTPVNGGSYAGLVSFVATANGIVVKANVTGLADGAHGIHIHQNGDILNSGQVGGHYDPLGSKYHALPGFLADDAHHIGDLGNICDNTAGVYYYQATFAAPKFADAKGIIGRALVIHSGPDNNGTVTYGSRLAYCVIGVAPSDFLADTFATPPVTFTSPLCGYAVPTTAPVTTTSDAADLATISVFIAITMVLAMLF